jgi:AraC family transcriptional regulator
MKRSPSRRWKAPLTAQWSALADEVGAEVVRFQEASNSVDTVAAAILAVDRRDLPCITLLLFGGPATLTQLADTLRMSLGATRDLVARLELAGYARRQSASHEVLELTEHARAWIARIWEPLRESGQKMLARFSSRELAVVANVLRTSSDIQEAHATALLRLIQEPKTSGPRHRRGGLSPAALRRVQLFVESNLERPLHMADLARRAGLSEFHFARAFRTSMGMTPRSFLEQQRIARARTLIENTDRTLADIALATGFGTQSHLTTAFRRAVGFTPAVYRRNRRS